ncbi:MAG: hypothetical protein CM1200mP6_11170 [Anaerolineaceae bacterium]|nr:MAG: hypothetical protein CM1200mP6_11170 [Anaerolineaceae bacterium]
MRANEMGDLDYSTQSMDNLRVGLCVTCKYIRVVSSDRGSYFVMCNLSRQDANMTNILYCQFSVVMVILLLLNQMTKRNLYSWEQQEAETVFSASIDYQRIIVHEGVRWTNVVDDWSRRCDVFLLVLTTNKML